MQASQADLFALSGHVDTYITPRYYFYGVVRSGETRLILGPTRQLPATEQQLRELAFMSNVPAEDTPAFIQAMRSLVPMPLESLQQILCTLNYVINGEKLSLEDIALKDPVEKQIAPAPQTVHHEQAAYAENHTTLAIEQTLMNMIRKGDTESLKAWIASAPAVHAGPMAQEHLRQYKNTFIVTATLAARSAIRGGMDVEEALSTSDLLIRNCEVLRDVQSILRLQVNMLLTYAEQVERLRGGTTPTPLAIAVASWTHRHLSEPIDTEKLAQELHYSRPHLSRKFKEETGMTLTDFILTKKSEEAARLLAFTDKSLIAISDYLGFSSQSHFARVFKKYMGKTPTEYRAQ
ncbi:MAG: helix-turn-helix domain-containing protein [Lachnospiraceae bacterium]|nr:helix-turn-helix domain-containing protein [Lachnospiraceae bacterium]